MEISSLKIRLSVLWISLAVAWVTWLVIVNEATSESIILVLAIFLLMVFLSMTLKDSVNRKVNIVMGIFFTGLTILGLVGSLVTSSSFFGILLEVLKVVIASVIVWYAYKWPKG
jgi:hypothetical protein